MSYKNCIIQGVKNGDITEAQAKKQNKLLDDLQEYYLETKGLTEAEADRAISREAFEQTKIETAQKLKVAILQKQKFQEIQNLFNTYRNANGEVDYANAYRAVLAQDNNTPIPNIENLQKIERSSATKYMANLLEQMQHNMGGRQTNQQKANLKLMVQELMGETTGNQNAKMLAQSWIKATDHLRKRSN